MSKLRGALAHSPEKPGAAKHSGTGKTNHKPSRGKHANSPHPSRRWEKEKRAKQQQPQHKPQPPARHGQKPHDAQAARGASEARAPRPDGASRHDGGPRPDGAPRHDGGAQRDNTRQRGGRRQRGSLRRGDGGARSKREPLYEPPLREGPPRQIAAVPPQDTLFSRLGLNDHIACAVAQKGYTEPTPIQEQAIPLVLAGRDVAGSAQTGTGKTAAFALPILQRLGSHGRLRCLVLEPTRELALQVEDSFRSYGKGTDLDVTIVYGGVGYGRQRDDLRRGVDILVATPGRLLDHMGQGDVSLDHIEILVLDEVDRMLDMGFLPDVRRIVDKCPSARQTLFFTATLPPEIARLASWTLRDPVEVKIGVQRAPAETVSHAFYPVVASQKAELLDELLKRTNYNSVIIFCRTKFGADRVARRLERAGRKAGVLHSDRSQQDRVEALNGFKAGTYEILVATDIAARGLDIADVSHVINYDVPRHPEDYVHRIGRTGRAHKTGEAFTIVTEEDVRDARSIERFIKAGVERKKLDGFNYIYSALFDEAAQAAAAPPKAPSRLRRGR